MASTEQRAFTLAVAALALGTFLAVLVAWVVSR